MRFTALIFSLYIFALALFPCADNADHSHKDESHIAISHTHSDADGHHTDMCSPFCLCQCCHTSVVELEVPFVPEALATLEPLKSNYNRNFQSGFPTGILHPPRA